MNTSLRNSFCEATNYCQGKIRHPLLYLLSWQHFFRTAGDAKLTRHGIHAAWTGEEKTHINRNSRLVASKLDDSSNFRITMVILFTWRFEKSKQDMLRNLFLLTVSTRLHPLLWEQQRGGTTTKSRRYQKVYRWYARLNDSSRLSHLDLLYVYFQTLLGWMILRNLSRRCICNRKLINLTERAHHDNKTMSFLDETINVSCTFSKDEATETMCFSSSTKL
jgi:hypothetical protein